LASARALETATTTALRDIGRRLKEARERKEVTQETLAERTGIDAKRVQRIENGKANVTIKTLVRIALALDVALDQLVRSDRARAR
jgi:transcriptional regulator with XRE-family HTH domain